MRTLKNTKRRLATAAMAFGLALAFGQASQAAGEKLAVEVSSVGESTLRAILDDAPLSIVRTGPTTIIETDAAGYKRLLAEESLTLVRLVGGASSAALAAQSRNAGATDVVEFVVRLRTASTQLAPGGGAINAAAAPTASHSAQMVSRRRAKDVLRPLDDPGPGMLLVRGLDGRGAEVTRAVIQDPRIIRSEAARTDGQLTGRREFLRTDAELHVTMPFDARVTTLTISAETGAGEKELARVPAR